MKIIRVLTARAALLFAVLLYFVQIPAAAQSSSLAGNWYGETVMSGTLEGENYNFRRWLRTNYPDGVERIVFRYYLDGRARGEEVWEGRWTFQGGVYSSTCRTFAVNGKSQSCSSHVEYDVQLIDSREMQYTSRSSGSRYRTSRVAEDFRLP